MTTNPDIPSLPESASTSGDDVLFDEVGHRAGAALRRPAPDDGLRLITHRRRRQPALKATVVGGVAVVALFGGLAFASRDDSGSVPPADSVPATLPATTTPAPAIDSAADQAAVEAALLTLSDFGPGWTEVAQPVDVETDRGLAECLGLDKEFTDFGGASAYTGEFRFPSGIGVSESVEFAPSVDAAAERIAQFAAPGYITCIEPMFERVVANEVKGDDALATVEEFTITELNVAPVGDEVVAFRATVTVGPGIEAVDYADDLVIRSGRALAYLHFESRGAPFAAFLVDQYVTLAMSRLTDS